MRGRKYSMCTAAVLCMVATAWADPIVTLNPSQNCYDLGETVTVTLDLTGSGFPNIVGGQFFLDFNATNLTFVSAAPGNPWTVEVYENVSGSRIDYAVGIIDGGSGATSGTMATLTFTALQEICDAAGLVSFNLDVPPGTIVGDEEDDEYSLEIGNLTLENLSAISIDGTPPTISGCPSNITQSNDAGNCSAVVTWTPPTANDNCPGVTLDSTHDPGDTFPVGVTTVTYTAEDACGNTNTTPCSFTVTVTEDEDPTISCPTDVTVNTDPGLCSATGVDLGTPTTDDNCSVASVVNDSSEPYALGDTIVTWTVTDDSGNTATCTQTVTVVDNEDPTIICPINVTVNADAGLCTASGIALGTPTTDDNCSVASVVNDASEPYALGDTIVTWTVTDGSGNTATCTQTVTVVDNEDPTISCPTDVTVNADAGLCTASGVALGTPTTDDNCSVASVVNDGSEPYALGDTIVTWTVTDDSGNTATCTQTVTVVDNEDPTIICPTDVTVNTDPGVCSATGVDLGTPTTDDNCSVASVVNDAAEPYALGDTIVTWTVTDGSGNTATCTQTVTVVDNEDPTIICPTDVTVNADAGLCTASGVALGTPTTDDNCSVASVVNDGSEPYALGDTIVTWTVTDGSGNTATCTQTVTVVDNEDPTISCPTDVTVNADAGLCTASGVALGTPTTDDNCSVASVVNDAAEPYALGDTIVTWTVTDGSGNTATCTQTVTVVDNEDPTIICPTDVTVNADAGLCTASGVALGTPTTDDNCSVASVTNDASEPYGPSDTTVTWTVTDGSGNTATCTQTVTVLAYNELVVDVALAGWFNTTFDRCITFELYDTDPCTYVEVEQVVEFVNGQSAGVLVLVPCGYYDCIRARDEEHTLWSTNTDDFGISGCQYVANFTDKTPAGDDDQLIVGNLNASQYIDIMDFVIYVNHWGLPLPVDLDCDYTEYHPDFNGDGLVDTLDFDWISFNFLAEDEDNCCGAKSSGDNGPLTEISVAELIKLGMGDFIDADLTGDGWVDADDIVAFLNGEWPDDDSSELEQIDPSDLGHSGAQPIRQTPAGEP